MRRAALGLVGAAGAVAVAHVLWLGWHAPARVAANGIDRTGPYSPGEVVGLGLTAAVVVVVAAWLTRAWCAAVGGTLGLVVTWSLDQATRVTPDANLWPVGTALLTVGAGVVAAGLAALTAVVRRRVRRGAGGGGSGTGGAP